MIGPYGLDTIVCGHVLDVLAKLPDESVHCVVTSPPYWGLRDYSLESQIWGGNSDDCRHVWGEAGTVQTGRQDQDIHIRIRGNPGDGLLNVPNQKASTGQYCQLCSAWRGSLGLEPTPGLFISHLVEVFREVRRVLRGDGVAFVNIGDSYAGSRGAHKQSHANPGISKSAERSGYQPEWNNNNLKPKDLVLIPERLAIALQEDGWWIRSRIIWGKGVSFGTHNTECPRCGHKHTATYSGSCMPGSQQDRPTTSYEHVWMLSKSAQYYYDGEAVKERNEGNSGWDRQRDKGDWRHSKKYGTRWSPEGSSDHVIQSSPTGRNLRSVWLINPQPLKEAHFATFPEALVEPMIKAGTSERGCCPECGNPWRRVVEPSLEYQKFLGRSWNKKDTLVNLQTGNIKSDTKGHRTGSEYLTTGWQPTCDHYDDHYRRDFTQSRNPRKKQQRQMSGDWWRRARRRPGYPFWPARRPTVLDPFMGAGTTGLVAKKLGRHYLGIELSPDYIEIANQRLGSVQLEMAL